MSRGVSVGKSWATSGTIGRAAYAHYFSGYLLLLLLLGPYLILCVHAAVSDQAHFVSADLRELYKSFLFTITQAAVSAFFTILLGLAGAYGLRAVALKWGEQVHFRLEMMALLPNLTPVLFLLLAALKYLPFARGLFGIVLLHVLLNVGLVAVAFSRVLLQKVAVLADLAWIEGASRWRCFFQVVLPVIRSDLAGVALFVFALCFSSLAISDGDWRFTRVDGGDPHLPPGSLGCGY